MSFERNDDTVTLTLTIEQWEELLFALGMATPAAQERDGRAGVLRMLRFINAVDEGNPDFTPYVLPDAPHPWPEGIDPL